MMRDTCDLNWVEDEYKASEFTTPVIAARPTRRVLDNGLDCGAECMRTKCTYFVAHSQRT